MLKAIPSFIYSKANQIFMILFVPIFAVIFINTYRPFDFDRIGEILDLHINISNESFVLVSALIMALSGMAIGAISRLIMGQYTKSHQLTYIGYVVWILAEIGVMATLFTIFMLFTDTDKSLPELLRNSYVNTVLIVLIPYSLSYILFVLRDKMRELKALRQQIENDETVLQKAYIQILDEKVKKSMVRNTLSRIAEHMQGTRIVRCHRSYMINLDHAQIFHRDKEGVFIELGIEGVPDIPISKTYADNVREWLTNRD